MIILFTPFRIELDGTMAKVQFFSLYDFKLKDTQSLAKHFIRFEKRLHADGVTKYYNATAVGYDS